MPEAQCDAVLVCDEAWGAVSELVTSVTLPPPATASGWGFGPLRATLTARGAACAHEAARFAVMLRSAPVSLETVRAGCAQVCDAAAQWTTASQALRSVALAGGSGGRVFSGDLHAVAAGMLLALAGCVQVASRELKPSADASSYLLGRPDALLPAVAMVEHWSNDGLTRLPTTPAAAVRRRVLSAAVAVRRSATDVREETSSATDMAIPNAGIAVLKALAAHLQAALAALDAAAAAPVGDAALAAAVAAVSLDATGSASPLDALADAASVASDAVIDFAAALSDASEEFGGAGGRDEDDDEEEGGGEGEVVVVGGEGGGNAVDTLRATALTLQSAAGELRRAVECVHPAPQPAAAGGAALVSEVDALLATLQSVQSQ